MTATKWTKRSLAAQAMGKIDPTTKGVVPPIHISTTYIRDEDNGYSTGFIYGRPDNETVHEAQAVLAMLEEAKAGALLFGSGMAAATVCDSALRWVTVLSQKTSACCTPLAKADWFCTAC